MAQQKFCPQNGHLLITVFQQRITNVKKKKKIKKERREEGMMEREKMRGREEERAMLYG